MAHASASICADASESMPFALGIRTSLKIHGERPARKQNPSPTSTIPPSPNAATGVHIVFPPASFRPLELARLTQQPRVPFFYPISYSSQIRESRWRFSPFRSSRPFLGTASGVIPAFCALRSFCFLRNHPKNFPRDARPKLKFFRSPIESSRWA